MPHVMLTPEAGKLFHELFDAAMSVAGDEANHVSCPPDHHSSTAPIPALPSYTDLQNLLAKSPESPSS